MNNTVVLNYNFANEDHVNETLMNGVVGIPNKKFTHGKNILNAATSEHPLYGILYDVASKCVRGIFSTLGEAFTTEDAETFTGDGNTDETWGHRIHVMANLTQNKAISRAEFLEMGGKTIRGSMARVDDDVWMQVKERITATN